LIEREGGGEFVSRTIRFVARARATQCPVQV
jgi:hypothetical protein